MKACAVARTDRVREVSAGPRRGARRLVSLGFVVALVALCVARPPVVRAAEMPVGLDVPVMIMARKQPVAEFLHELLGEVGVPVRVDPAVRGPVNGDFDKPLRDVLDEVRYAFKLTYYYDGAVLHVYPASALDRKILYVSPSIAKRVLEDVGTLRLTDDSNALEHASMGLVVTGTPRFIEQVEELAGAAKSRAAAADAPETIRVFNLKYGWADDISLVLGGQKVVIPGVVSVLRDLVGAEGVGADTDPEAVLSGVQRAPLDRTRPKLRGEGLQSIGAAAEATPDGTAPSGERSDASVTTRGGRGSGRVRIVADPLHNAVVIRDRADRMSVYERLIAKLDVEPLMVEIEATIIDMNADRLRELGIDWRVEYGLRSNPVSASAGTPASERGIVSLVLGDRARFFSNIRALERQGAARVVSKPHVTTLANVEALLDSTSTFFVRVAGNEEVDLFDVSVGTTMRVTPHVLENGGRSRIKLLVTIEDGQASDRRVDRIPVIDRSTINTQALVREGQSLLIGGLIRESDENSVSKVPLLGDIPGIGALFRSNAKSARRTERLFLITPRLTAATTEGERSLDAPIIYGSEGDIIGSAPIRLRDAQAALEERDTRFPLLPALPSGTTDAELTDEAGTARSGYGGRSPVKLIEDPPDDSGMPTPSAVTAGGGVTATSAGGDDARFLEDDGWQAVPGSSPDGGR